MASSSSSSSSSSSVAAVEMGSIDPLVWKGCAGSSVHIPPVGSLVYYFPQGHAEQASPAPDLSSSMPADRPCSLCRLTAVHLLANQVTDEVYARMGLDPRISVPAPSPPPECSDAGNGVMTFAKVLTPSDANNGGGFSVPRFCADSIFPALNYNEDPPVQKLFIRDVRGVVWQFRHIYRGTPRRHLLTTGWSRFVNSKKLVAGDAVVFIKKRSGELFVGLRRTGRSAAPREFLQYSSQTTPPAPKLGENSGLGERFSRNCGARVTPEAVVEATKLAGMGHPFEVVYYPRAGSPDFVVSKDVVDSAVCVPWSTGTRVKMAMETEDLSRMTTFQGTVSCVVRRPVPFTYSPWRTLEVTWDEPDVLQNVKRVNPWQVELSVSPEILTPYPIIKKPKITQDQELPTDGAEESMFSKVAGSSNKMMGSINISMFSHNTFPVGIQGARHDPICVSSISNVQQNGTHHEFLEKINDNIIPREANHMYSDIRVEPQSESSSPPSQNSIHCYGSELLSNSAGSTPSKVINGSFQLFGTTIYMEQPVVADVKERNEDNNVTVKLFDISLSYPQKPFHDDHDGQLKGFSAVET